MKNSTIAIILAAEDGADMGSSLPKVMHKISGRPMVEYLIQVAQRITNNRPLLVLGQMSQELEEVYGWDIDVIGQKGQIKAETMWDIDWETIKGKAEYGLILSGNLPLITSETLNGLLELCKEGPYDGVCLSPLPKNGALALALKVEPFLVAFDKLNSQGGDNNWQDLLDLMDSEGKGIGTYDVGDPIELMSINNRVDQWEVQREMTLRINRYHLERGVTIIDPYNTYIGPYVEIKRDATIYPGNHLEGKVTVGEGSILYPNNRIVDSVLGRKTEIQSSVILESSVEDMATIGPFAYLRPGSKIGKGVRVGDFVEIKNAEIGDGTKVSHLSYIGDARVGKKVNVGGGVIFVNYDGNKKHMTIVEDNAFIGCNTNLVAPVKVGRDGYIAAGSTITDEVPEGALSIARARQINKEDWVRKHKNETEENQ